MTHSPSSDNQASLWNGPAGRAWVELQELLDQVFKPFERLLVDAVVARHASRILDVGCGAGATTLAMARRVSAHGRCIGVDISEPLVALARERAEWENTPATFIHADAQTYSFEPASFDM